MSFFTARGRLRRRNYWLRVLLLGTTGVGVYALPTLLPNETGHMEWIAAGGLVVIYYLMIVQVLKRLHDLNLSGWWALLSLLPLLNYALGYGVQLVQGTIGPNRFGPDPKRPALLAALPEEPVLPDSSKNS